jgi:hypothetical protein
MAYPSEGSKRDKVRKYLQTHFVDQKKSLEEINKKDLARVLINQFPGVWKSIEQARSTIRDVMGCSGPKTRDSISDNKKKLYFVKI